jgi:RIO-like serine/threonine protein kinase
MAYSEAQKRATYKWNKAHREDYNCFHREKNLRYYYEHKEVLNKQKVKRAIYRRECNYDYVSKLFRKILL